MSTVCQPFDCIELLSRQDRIFLTSTSRAASLKESLFRGGITQETLEVGETM